MIPPLRHLLRAALLILASPRTLLLLALPWLFGLATFVVLSYLSVSHRHNLVLWTLGSTWNWATALLDWLAALAGIVFSGFISVISMTLVGGWFIEQALFLQGRALGFFDSEGESPFFVSLLRALASDAARLSLGAFVLLLGAVLSLAGPASFLATLPAVALIGFDAFSLPFSLQERSFSDRIRWCRANLVYTFGLGAVILLFSLVPFGAVIILPLGHIAAMIRVVEKGTCED